MSTMASQITSLTVVYSIVYSGTDQRNIKVPRHWPLCGEFTGTGEFPAQRASNAENVSIWWRHHVPVKWHVWTCINRACLNHNKTQQSASSDYFSRDRRYVCFHADLNAIFYWGTSYMKPITWSRNVTAWISVKHYCTIIYHMCHVVWQWRKLDTSLPALEYIRSRATMRTCET